MSVTRVSDGEIMTQHAGRFARARAATAVGLTLALSLTLSGCISGGSAGEAPAQTGEAYAGEIEWWTINLQKNYADYINGMIETYEAEHPDVTITWVDVPGQDITTKLLASIASGDVPDAVNYTSTTTGLFDDSMADLHDYFTAEELAAYAPGLVAPLETSDGRQIAIPWYNGGTTLAFYNTALLSAAGFDPTRPPTTYEDALELAQAHRDATGNYATNFMAYSTVVQAYGIPLLSDDGTRAAFNTDETTALLETFKTYLDSGAIAPGSLSADQRNLPQSLVNEQVAFNPVATSSRLLNIKKNAPAVYENMVVAPPVTGPSGRYYMPGQQIFGIPTGSDNQAAAAEWLKFVTSAENQLAFCKLVAIYPSTLETLEDPFFTDIDDDSPAGQARGVLRDTFAKSVDGSLGSGNDEQLRQLFDEQVRAFMAGDKSAREALGAAEASWNEELAKGQ
jgi:putative chitobiose transport system substrate-binding protein